MSDPEKWHKDGPTVGGQVLGWIVAVVVIAFIVWFYFLQGDGGGSNGHQPNDDCLPGVSC